MIIPFPYRILVTGSRDWDGEQELRLALIAAWTPHQNSLVVVHGACPSGADAMAAEWVRHYDVRAEPHPADWDGPCRAECKPGHRRTRRDGSDYCPAAGNYRNQQMADAGAAACLAFFQAGAANTGTSDCVRRAVAAGIPVTPYGQVPQAIAQLLRPAGQRAARPEGACAS